TIGRKASSDSENPPRVSKSKLAASSGLASKSQSILVGSVLRVRTPLWKGPCCTSSAVLGFDVFVSDSSPVSWRHQIVPSTTPEGERKAVHLRFCACHTHPIKPNTEHKCQSPPFTSASQPSMPGHLPHEPERQLNVPVVVDGLGDRPE